MNVSHSGIHLFLIPRWTANTDFCFAIRQSKHLCLDDAWFRARNFQSTWPPEPATKHSENSSVWWGPARTCQCWKRRTQHHIALQQRCAGPSPRNFVQKPKSWKPCSVTSTRIVRFRCCTKAPRSCSTTQDRFMLAIFRVSACLRYHSCTFEMKVSTTPHMRRWNGFDQKPCEMHGITNHQPELFNFFLLAAFRLHLFSQLQACQLPTRQVWQCSRENILGHPWIIQIRPDENQKASLSNNQDAFAKTKTLGTTCTRQLSARSYGKTRMPETDSRQCVPSCVMRNRNGKCLKMSEIRQIGKWVNQNSRFTTPEKWVYSIEKFRQSPQMIKKKTLCWFRHWTMCDNWVEKVLFDPVAWGNDHAAKVVAIAKHQLSEVLAPPDYPPPQSVTK